MMQKHNILLFVLVFFSMACSKQSTTRITQTVTPDSTIKPDSDRWQMGIDYKMDIDVDAEKHQYKGKQTLVLSNNSPDDLYQVFYHLYFNAFQPGSMMDERNIVLSDSDRRVGSRIGNLSEDEIGYIKVKSLKQNGRPVMFSHEGTILEVQLNEAVKSGGQATFVMEYDAQVPIQIRRSGRDNAEGIEFSMSQWYPKMCNYDYQGWHANPYVGREFYGIWGDFDVTIHIDKNYIVAATGDLVNKDEIDYGYNKASAKPNGKMSYQFVGKNIHDFVWAADPDYKHIMRTTPSGILMHFYYQENERTKDNWMQLPIVMEEAFDHMDKIYGKYPYPSYAFIQGGDGGMEYPMATLITGERRFSSLVGVSVHELFHSWYQMILGSNEALHSWMDEGFTSFGTARTMNHLRSKTLVPGKVDDNPNAGSLMGYVGFSKSGYEEPLSTHADHFNTNSAYGVAAYTKGAVFLSQLEYIIGKDAFNKTMLNYFNTWKFKSPNPNDFIRIAEKTSNLELDWYKEYWINTTHTIDYAVEDAQADGDGSIITLSKLGLMPMPIDVMVRLNDDSVLYYNIPMRIMRGNKDSSLDMKLKPDWPWTNPKYTLEIDVPLDNIKSIEIDESFRMADVNRMNNTWKANSN